MPTIELTDREAEAVRRMRLTPQQRNIENLARNEAARQALLAQMTPEARAAAQAAYDAKMTEHARVLNLPPAEREATTLLQRKDAIVAEHAKIDASLARPEIAAVVAKVTTDLNRLKQ